MLPESIRSINKRFINPITRRLARLPFGPFAIIRHIGRHSGKTYDTPIMVEPMGDQLVIALTYGENVDWYRNFQAAGKAVLFWHTKTYRLEQPKLLEAQVALRYYPPLQKLILKTIGAREFVSVKYQQKGKFDWQQSQ